MDSLIARLEAATEGTLELGIAVSLACGWMQNAEGDLYLPGKEPDDCYWRNPTLSLDAAMTLVPEGCSWTLTQANKQFAFARCFPTSKDSEIEEWGVESNDAKTPAIALCIAALRARQAQGEK